jgi:hypothetical protein
MLGIVSPLLSAVPGVSHRFFGRVGGTSPTPWNWLNVSHTVGDSPARVDENLARVRFQLGVGRHALFTARQMHGRDVVVVDDADDVTAVADRAADAVVTRRAAVAVGVRTADCAPILLAADDGSVVAAAHAGWRGAVGGVVEATVAALGVAPERVVAAVGPCIGPRAFEVGPEVIAAAREHLGANDTGLGGLVAPGGGDRRTFDLAGYCALLLRRAGVVRIDVVGGCTVEQFGVYFSHRRDAGDTGRQMSAIARATPPDLDDEAFR